MKQRHPLPYVILALLAVAGGCMNKRAQTPGRIQLPGGLELTYGSDGTEHKPADVYEAVEYGDLAAVKAWIAKHPDQINTRQSAQSPHTLLHLAAWQGQVSIIHFLVDHGAEIDAKGERALTPLHYAAEHGQTAAIQALIERGAAADNNDPGFTPLMWGAACGLRERSAVEALVRHGADIRAKDKRGWTIMQIAGIGGATAVAEVLHEHGMDYDLHAALMLGKTDEIRKILKDPDAVKRLPIRAA